MKKPQTTQNNLHFCPFSRISILCCCGAEIIAFGLVLMVISANSGANSQLKVGVSIRSRVRLYSLGFWLFFSILQLDCETEATSKITFNRSGLRIDFIARKTSRSIMIQDLQNTCLQLLIWLHLAVNYGKWTRWKYIGSWNLQCDQNNRSATKEKKPTQQFRIVLQTIVRGLNT